MKKIISFIIAIFVLTTISTSLHNSVMAQNSEYKYAKMGYFIMDNDTKCIAWVDECTSESGGSCSQPNASFKTCVLTLKLPVIQLPQFQP